MCENIFGGLWLTGTFPLYLDLKMNFEFALLFDDFYSTKTFYPSKEFDLLREQTKPVQAFETHEETNQWTWDLIMSRRRSRSQSPGRYSRSCSSNDPRDLERRIFVGNLPTSDMEKKDLEDMFSPYGKILGQ